MDYNNDVMPAFYNNSMVFRAKGVMADAATEESAAEEPLDFKTVKLTYSVQAKFVLK